MTVEERRVCEDIAWTTYRRRWDDLDEWQQKEISRGRRPRPAKGTS